jgi:hypothetical protein
MNYFVEKNKSEALKNFVIYQKRKKESNIIIIQGHLVGLPATKGFIYEALGNSKFSKNPIKIPDGYKKMRRTENKWNDNWVLKYYLNKYISPEAIKKLNQEGCDFEKWYKKSRKYWLTIEQIKKLKPNEKVKLLVLDRNVLDNKINDFKTGKLYKPENYFKDDTAIYWKNSNNNLQGKIKYKWQNSADNAFDFEFDIEYKKDNWYPLENGTLPATDPQGFFQLLGEDKSWDEFSIKNHIGMRGPMILWKYIQKLPKIYQI